MSVVANSRCTFKGMSKGISVNSLSQHYKVKEPRANRQSNGTTSSFLGRGLKEELTDAKCILFPSVWALIIVMKNTLMWLASSLRVYKMGCTQNYFCDNLRSFFISLNGSILCKYAEISYFNHFGFVTLNFSYIAFLGNLLYLCKYKPIT